MHLGDVATGGDLVRLGLVGFTGEPPAEIVGACETLGIGFAGLLDTPDLWLYDARHGVDDDALQALASRELVALAYGTSVENDPVFDGAFDDLLTPGAGEGAIRRRLTLALRLAGATRGGASERDQGSEAVRLANASLEFALRRFEALFQGLPVACFTMDLAGMVHEWNREASEIFGLPAYAAIYQMVEDLLGESWSVEALTRRLETPDGATFDWSWRRPEGRTVHLACRLLAMRSESGEHSVIVATNLDVTARVAAQKKADRWARRAERQSRKLVAANDVLNAIALTDPLTGLGNRRRFDEMLDAARERERREGRPFALLLLDIDHFKSVNDAFGHAAGDEILREMARVLRRCARKLETPSRFGGEEFAIVLENCDAAKASLVAARIRTTMSAWNWPHRAITASIGIALSKPDETPESLYDRADAALYEAKHGGRDQARFAA